MATASTLPSIPALERFRRIDWSMVSVWLLGFGLVAYLGLKGGGYDPLVHDQVGIAIWWIILGGVLVGALPRRPPGTLAWTALGLFAAFVAWTALGLFWSESVEKSWLDLARSATYLGVFALAVLMRGSMGARRMVAAVGSAIVFVSILALLSRLHPAWFPGAEQTAKLLESSRSRLSYPLNYWNGLAALIAVGLPLMLHVAGSAKSVVLRSLAAAALPAMALTTFLTLSRGGTVAAVVGLVVYLALTTDRLPKLGTLLTASAGGAILIGAVAQRHALQHGLLDTSARSQGDEMLVMAIAVCVGVALIQAGLSIVLAEERRPSWSVVPRKQARAIAIGAIAAALLAAAAFDAPSRLSSAWGEFKQPSGSAAESGARLATITGNGRYQYWESAAAENRSSALNGTGPGTFEYWWARNGTLNGFVQDAHSLYMQTLGEQGIVGLALLGASTLAILAGGLWRALGSSSRKRAQLAAALAGCVAFCSTTAVDWTWQLPAVAITPFLLGAVLVTAGDRSRPGSSGLGLPLRGAIAVVAVAAIAAIAVPLASTALVRQSQAAAREGDLAGALLDARSAGNAQPAAASPRLQEALVLEDLGSLAAAGKAARSASRREPTNWKTWFVLFRVESERGHVAPALRAFRRARSLNPRSSAFSQ